MQLKKIWMHSNFACWVLKCFESDGFECWNIFIRLWNKNVPFWQCQNRTSSLTQMGVYIFFLWNDTEIILFPGHSGFQHNCVFLCTPFCQKISSSFQLWLLANMESVHLPAVQFCSKKFPQPQHFNKSCTDACMFEIWLETPYLQCAIFWKSIIITIQSLFSFVCDLLYSNFCQKA